VTVTSALINQFKAELATPGTDLEERIMALKFLFHFVGDIHQPLHSSDNGDEGGNDIEVTADGIPHKDKDELHGYWDNQFVQGVAPTDTALAAKLLAAITSEQRTSWAAGTPEEWAMETFAISKRDAYGNPPLSKGTLQDLNAEYVAQAEKDVAKEVLS
jgi:S1/P1 Nuclease